MVDLPAAAHPYRVPRSRLDDLYDRNDRLPYLKVGGAEVVSVSANGETCVVDFSDEQVGGVVVLGDRPEPGDWVEVTSRGNLLVITDSSGGGGGGLQCYVQPDEPAGVPVGTLWFDTDAVR